MGWPFWVVCSSSLFGGGEGLDGFARDHEFFVGGEYVGGEGAVGGGDEAAFAEGAGFVGVGVEVGAEGFEVFEDGGAGRGGVFADTAGEDDGVGPAEGGVVAADEEGGAVGEHFEGGVGFVAAGVCGGDEFAHVAAAGAGDGEESAFFVEHVADVFGAEALAFEVEDDAGVDVAATGAHDEAGEGGEAHGGVEDFAAVNGGDGGAVAEVAGDEFELFDGFAEVFGGGVGDEFVAGAVEAVFADAELGVEVFGDGVEVGVFGHGLVEGGVEDDDVGDAGEGGFAGADAVEVGGVVEGCEDGGGADGFFNGVGDEDGGGEFFSAVDDAVADGVDFFKGFEGAVLGVGERLADDVHGFEVVGGDDGGFGFGLAGELVDEVGFGGADAFDEAFGEHFFGGDGEEHEFDGGAAGVDDEDFFGFLGRCGFIHYFNPLFEMRLACAAVCGALGE